MSAELIRDQFRTVDANVTGRRTFEDAGAWGGRDPYGVPSFIVSYTVPAEWSGPNAPFAFVTEGVASAIAQAKAAAGNKHVAVAAASIAQQCLRLGLLEEIQLHIAPGRASACSSTSAPVPSRLGGHESLRLPTLLTCPTGSSNEWSCLPALLPPSSAHGPRRPPESLSFGQRRGLARAATRVRLHSLGADASS